jgi:hypothetical protein
MKTPALALALIVSFFVAATPTLHADDLLVPLKDAVLTGNILTSPVTPNAKVVLTPLTRATLLGLFGFSNVSPASTAYFVDLTNATVILADKNKKTIYGTVFALQLFQSHASAVGKSGSQNYADTPATLVGTAFTGTVFTHVTTTKVGKQLRDSRKDSFNGYGTIDGASSPDAIISGTFQGSYVALTL